MPSQSSGFPVESVEVTVDSLPRDVARQLRDFQVDDPDFLRRVLLYGVVHRTVFETLASAWPAKQLTDSPG